MARYSLGSVGSSSWQGSRSREHLENPYSCKLEVQGMKQVGAALLPQGALFEDSAMSLVDKRAKTSSFVGSDTLNHTAVQT